MDGSRLIMIGLVIVSHSRRIAEGVVELARAMSGGGVRMAAAGGLDLPDSPLGTDPLQIARAIEETVGPEGVLVLMDLGSAVLNAEMALELLQPEHRGKVLLCEAPLVEGAVVAAVEARLGSSLEKAAEHARLALAPKADHLRGPQPDGLHPEEPAATRESLSDSRPVLHQNILMTNPLGMHARPAARCVQALAGFDAEVSMRNATTGHGPASARSMHELATLGARQGHTLEVTARGTDAEAALSALETLAAAHFGDVDPASRPAARPGGISPPPADSASDKPHAQAPGERQGQTSDEPHDRAAPWQGHAASSGIAIGPVRRIRPAAGEPAISADMPADPNREIEAFERAIADSRAHLQRLQAELAGRASADAADIFSAHALLLDDNALVQPTRRAIQSQGHTAAAAWQRTVQDMIAGYDALDDDLRRARTADVQDVAGQVSLRLAGRTHCRISLSGPGILLAEDLTPAQAVTLDPAEVHGVCTAAGSTTSHSAVLLRSLGIPAVVGAGPDVLVWTEGTPVVVDGSTGQVWVNPPAQVTAAYARRSEADRQALAEAQQAAQAAAVTRDGVRVEVLANIGSSTGARTALLAGADGVGLFRTEFLFLDRTRAPDEAEQTEAYLAAANIMRGRPMVIRTLDVGGDKPLSYLQAAPEPNPFLGCRGVRFCLAHPAIFLEQLRAIARTAAESPISVMFPMVTTQAEWRACLGALDEACAQVGLSIRPPAGVMVEVPALALQAEQFAAEVDFFSIGTNDLTQYTLAAERGNPQVASLGDALHPAVLKLIARVVDAAHAHGKRVSLCGELAADPPAVPVLLGLGVDTLSMSPPAVSAAKQAVRDVSLPEAKHLAEAALGAASSEEVRALVRG